MGISVVLLAYKEEENLRILLPEIKKNVEKCEKNYEILVVDTETPLDNTAGVCEEFGARYVNQREPGFGGAFRTAIEEARQQKFLILDSDGSHPPRYIPEIYRKFNHDKCDVVIGSRYCKGGESNDAKSSQMMSHLLNFAFRIALGIKARDLSTDYRMYHTSDLKKVKLTCKNYDVLQEVLLAIKLNKPKHKINIGEVPISFNKRIYGESKRQLFKFIMSYAGTIFRLFGKRIAGGFRQ
ncbi:MAG: glycosyltransferase [Lachnospiraceae bacterium]|nr:glycosyltransferase [Lachnospiraceae bacterium]